MAKTRFYADLRRLAKQANQRMKRLEQAGIRSPAYEAVQAKLEMMGRRSGEDYGRRFSETGKATYNEYQQIKKVLESFIEQKTSRVKGAKDYIEAVWQGAMKSDRIATDIKKAGITKDEWFEIWKALPDKEKRLYGSEQYIKVVATYKVKAGKLGHYNIDVGKLVRDYENSKSMKAASKALGLSIKDFARAKSMGVL